MSKERYLYIPVEIYRRELNGMLILALLAAEKGWKVILGGKKEIFPRLNKLPEGVVLSKSIVPGEYDNLKRIISEGHKIISLDAEGLIIEQGELGATSRYSQQTAALAELLFFWGNKQFERVQKYFPTVKSIGHVVGSPVFDYWRYQKFLSQKKPPRERKVILIATSFPFPNHVISEDLGRKLFKDSFDKNLTDEKYLEEFFPIGELLKISFPQFQKFTTELIREFPECDFILRPHISENPKPWIEIGNKFKNVTMSLTENFSSVLVKSDMLIHFNSTTAIEAKYHDKAVITYIPTEGITEKLYAIFNDDAMAASHVCRSLDEAITVVQNLKKDIKPKTNLVLKEIIEDCDVDLIYNSSNKIVEAINGIAPSVNRQFPSQFSLMVNFEMLKRALKLRIVWVVAWIDHLTSLFNGKYALSKDYYKYGNTKQGIVDFNEVRTLANEMINDFGFNGHGIKIKQLKNGMYFISNKN